jgi:hypothetical protein
MEGVKIPKLGCNRHRYLLQVSKWNIFTSFKRGFLERQRFLSFCLSKDSILPYTYPFMPTLTSIRVSLL